MAELRTEPIITDNQTRCSEHKSIILEYILFGTIF